MKKVYIYGAVGVVLVIFVVIFIGKTNTSKNTATTTNIENTTNAESPVEASSDTNNTYITLSEYESNKQKYQTTKVVYFFHASWCPICQSIHKEIISNPSKIPEDVTIIKTDFDTSTNVRKDYGVTTQYTFVQVDQNNKEIAQWTATTLDKALAGIQ